MAVGAYLSHLKGSERGKFSHLSNVEYPMEPFMWRVGQSVDRIVNDVFEVRNQLFYGDFRTSGVLREARNNPSHELRLRRSVHDPKHRWIDGTPLNSSYIWILATMFPQAQFIHNLRRPSEVATSLEGFATVGADPQPLEDGLHTWIDHTENAWFAERAFGAGRVFRADFSRITQDPEPLLREICAFLGEEYSSDCIKPLGTRLNSSEVDDRREADLEKLRDLQAFKKAEALYSQIMRQRIPDEGEEFALGVLKQRFLDYCHDRALV